MASMTFPETANNPHQNSFALCRHFEMLGVSAALKPIPDRVNLIQCTICGLIFHVKSEGVHLMVTHIEPINPDQEK